MEGSFTRDSERHVKDGFGNAASLSTKATEWEPGERTPLLRTLRDMYTKALGTKHFFLQEICKGMLSHFCLKKLSQYVYWTGNCNFSFVYNLKVSYAF